MTNEESGVFEIKANGKTYKVRFGAAAIRMAEREMGIGLPALFKQIRDPEEVRISNVIILLQAGLQDYHEGLTEDQAFEILRDVGTSAVSEVLARAINAAFPTGKNAEKEPETPPDDKGEAAEKNPGKAAGRKSS